MIRITDQYFWNIIFTLFYLSLVTMGVIVLQGEAAIGYDALDVFDIVLIKKIKENLKLKVVAENITNEGVRYTQGGKLFEKYKLGINYKVGVSYSW